MSSSFASPRLGRVSPRILKMLRKLRPDPVGGRPTNEVIPLQNQLDLSVEGNYPEWISCGIAGPHRDWNAYFLTVSMKGRREFGESSESDGLKYLPLSIGDVFVVDGSQLHWLLGRNNVVPTDWWIGLQWELDPEDNSFPKTARKILDFLEVERVHPDRVFSRYREWL